MVRPRIGLTLDIGAPDEKRRVYELNVDYVNAVLRAGGMPVLLPQTHDADLRQEMVASLDGLLIPGGSDLDPSLYGQPKHTRTKLIDKERQTFDLAILSLAEQRGLPTLGICLGCQLMNVHRRGTLHQHLPEVERDGALEHSRPGDLTNFHAVTIHAGTRLAGIFGARALRANSRHHQGVAKLGHGLIASAVATDGLVEGIEDPTLPFWLAVQWHPENLSGSAHDALFSALVAAARKK